MFVGILQFELHIAGAVSLKDKRRVVRSLKDRLHREHLVSIAEIGALDHVNVAVLGMAVVANTAARAGEVLDQVLAKLHRLHDAEIAHLHREIVKGEAVLERAAEMDESQLQSPFTDADTRVAESMLKEHDS
jgi:hypothetical protein